LITLLKRYRRKSRVAYSDRMERVVKGKKKIGEAVEEEGSEKRTGENLGKKVDPVSVLKVKNGDKRSEARRCFKGQRSHASTAVQAVLTDSGVFKDLEEVADDGIVVEELQVNVLQKQVVDVEAVDEVIEISSDDEEAVDATTGKREIATSKEQATKKELVKTLEAQISAMSLELECPVCLNVCAPPIYTCLEQHPVCSGCRSNLQECPMCSEPYKQRMMRHRYAERDFEKLEEAQRQLLALQDEKSHVEADGSLKRQATKLQTEYETQKKKLKMDNLTQQELKRKEEEKVSKKEITEHKDTAPSFPVNNRRKGKIDTLMEQVRALEAQMETAAQVRENMREAELALQRKEGELQTLRGLVDSSEREVQALKATGNHRLAAFGAQMPKIVEEIRKCKEFTKPPIGPLGAHINMVDGADEQLTRAVEAVLGELVSCFLCDNSADHSTLDNLFQKMQLPSIPLILTWKFSDVKCNFPATTKVQHDRYKTLGDCVDIADANVFNRVFLGRLLNRVLFIPTEAEAQRLLSEVTTVPENLFFAKVPNYEYYPAPNYFSIFKQDQTRGVLMESSKVMIAKREEQLVSEKAAVARVEPKVAEANAQRRRLEKQIREQVNQLKGVQDQLRLVKGQICELKNKEARDVAVPEDYLCDDCRYVTASHVGRMVSKRIYCACHPCKLNRSKEVVEA